MKKKSRNFIARDLFSPKYKKRIIKPKKGRGSFKRKKKVSLVEVNPENLFKTECDIISPCALGGAINKSNREKLKCKSIVGAANNQLDNSLTAD